MLNDAQWAGLLQAIYAGSCVPFIGSGAASSCTDIPSAKKLAQKWAKKYKYPVPNCESLEKIAQYMAVPFSDTPKKLISEVIKNNTKVPDFNKYEDPYSVLASLNLPLYITTNYDNLMERAIEVISDRQKIPSSVICLWNKDKKKVWKDKLEELKNNQTAGQIIPTLDFKSETDKENPTVYHFHGHIDLLDSIVITEDDYVESIANIAKYTAGKTIPPYIDDYLKNHSLLFLGYSIEDWDLRVLMYIAKKFKNKVYLVEKPHVSVMHGNNKEEEEYLEKYFIQKNIYLQPQDCSEFAMELKRRWDDMYPN